MGRSSASDATWRLNAMEYLLRIFFSTGFFSAHMTSGAGESPFESLNLSGHARQCLEQMWHLRLADATERRRYQSRCTQDEQQHVLAHLCHARPLCDDAVSRIRNICSDDTRLTLDDKRHRRSRRATLEWAQGVDAVSRAEGTLALSVKIYVNARRVGKNHIDTFLGWDPERLYAEKLDVREAALLKEALDDVRATGLPRTVMVLTFLIYGQTHWPKQEYDGHITKIMLRPDGTALYEDHAMSTAERLENEDIRVWEHSGQYFVEPCAAGATGGKRKIEPRPDWARPDKAKRISSQNRWQVAVFEALRAHLVALGCDLVHEQLYSLQSFATPQCAVAMLFDQVVRVPDALRRRVCDIFCGHADCTPPRRKARGDDRSGNDVLMQLFESWLEKYHSNAFELAAEWRKANSLHVGALLSSGVCDICDQFDTPDLLLLCEEDSCPCAMHAFCGDASVDAPWRCQWHEKEKNALEKRGAEKGGAEKGVANSF